MSAGGSPTRALHSTWPLQTLLSPEAPSAPAFGRFPARPSLPQALPRARAVSRARCRSGSSGWRSPRPRCCPGPAAPRGSGTPQPGGRAPAPGPAPTPLPARSADAACGWAAGRRAPPRPASATATAASACRCRSGSCRAGGRPPPCPPTCRPAPARSAERAEASSRHRAAAAVPRRTPQRPSRLPTLLSFPLIAWEEHQADKSVPEGQLPFGQRCRREWFVRVGHHPVPRLGRSLLNSLGVRFWRDLHAISGEA